MYLPVKKNKTLLNLASSVNSISIAVPPTTARAHLRPFSPPGMLTLRSSCLDGEQTPRLPKQARQRLRDMAAMMKEYGWRVPEAQRLSLIHI